MINASQIYDYDFLGNDWGFYIDIEKPYSNYDFDQEYKHTNLYKLDEYCIMNQEAKIITKQQELTITEETKSLITLVPSLTIFIIALSYCFWNTF